MSVKCAECQCTPQECLNMNLSQRCKNCTKESCCCTLIHHNYASSMKLSLMDDDNCCYQGICKNDSNNTTTKEISTKNKKSLSEFFRHVKSMYATALGIEILCIAAAEIGENTGLYILGFNHIGVPIAYAMAYGLACLHSSLCIAWTCHSQPEF